MKFIKLFGKLLLALVGCVVLIYLVAVAINWRDLPPSAEWRRLHKVINDRPLVADGENSYVYLLGFQAPVAEDPAVIGARRREWIESSKSHPLEKSADSFESPLKWHAVPSKEMQQLKEVCTDAERKACAETFDTVARRWQASQDDSMAMGRYEKLLTIPHWREVVVTDFSAPLPPFADVINAQRLEYLRLWQLAGAGETAGIKRFLGADFRFWRATLRATNGLINRMIAVAALRNHFFFANQSLRKLPPDQQMSAVPDEWSEEFTAQDRSMTNVMAGELLYIDVVVGDHADGRDQFVGGEDESEFWNNGVGGRLIGQFARPLFQRQDEANHYAESFGRFAEAFDVPMSRYETACAIFTQEEERRRSMNLYNLSGNLMRTTSPGLNYIEYAYRSAGVEGMRRATLLTTQLRARGVPAGEVEEELDAAKLRDPYTAKAFEWSADEQAVVFEGPEKHRWHRQVYFY